ncbi:MAG: cytochrome d ubiquinol oxidase subunit II [Anaerolineales bacterium]|nr:cytochrome d ubiquinol oxidase subunit II [Anaerolineales bacterium]
MDLNILWFILIGILFSGFFFLEGFDYGVGILLPFLGKNDRERRVLINTIGPVWDGNEVWLITAGGAMFAAFPGWYATLFSGFYLALVILLLALILRGVAFEFRSKLFQPAWRNLWDALLFVGSLLPALLWGVAMANLINGVPIDAGQILRGGLLDMISAYTLLGGVFSLLLFVLHGAMFLRLKVSGDLEQRAGAVVKRLWPFVLLAGGLLMTFSSNHTDLFDNAISTVLGAAGLLSLLICGIFSGKKPGWGFIFSGLTILLSTAALFTGLFPRVMVSSLDPAWSLTIYNTSSSPYTLRIMSIVAAVFVPLVLVYQGWAYYIFRKRLNTDSDLEY